MKIYQVVYEYVDYDVYDHQIVATFLNEDMANDYKSLLTMKLEADVDALKRWHNEHEAHLEKHELSYHKPQKRSRIDSFWYERRQKCTEDFIKVHGPAPTLLKWNEEGTFDVEVHEILDNIPPMIGYV
jgi:hypothetical protein